MSLRVVVTVLIGTSLVALASAQTSSESTPPPPPSQNFEEAKAQHIARLEKELTCIQA